MIVDYTPDTLPDKMRAELEHYGEDMWCFRIRDDGHPTCRAVNRYTDNLRIPARYISPKDILDTAWTDPLPEAIHVISELRFLDQYFLELAELRRRREWAPQVVWEPLPYDCVPERLEGVRRIAGQVDILTPNHTEALTLLSMAIPEDEGLLRLALEDACRQLVTWSPRHGVVIRAGSLGSCFMTTLPGPSHSSEVTWIPAYWSTDNPDAREMVVDPTGAGNAFCGALAAALANHVDLNEGKNSPECAGLRIAVLRATISASYMIEQHGLPGLSGEGDEELWNGERPADRLRKLRIRVAGRPL